MTLLRKPPRTDDYREIEAYFRGIKTELDTLEAAVNTKVTSPVTLDDFLSDLRPVKIVSALPSLPDSNYPDGAVVVLTTDHKVYRNESGSWTKAVDGGDVVVNTITAGAIQAGAITASHLKITDTTNMIRNNDFQEGIPDGWNLGGTSSLAFYGDPGVPSGAPSKYLTKMPVVAGYYTVVSQTLTKIPVIPGEVLYGGGWFASDASAPAGSIGTLTVQWTDRDDASPTYSTILSITGPSQAWAEITGQTTVPAGKYFAKFYLQSYHASSSGGNFFAALPSVRRTNTANLYVDGSIAAAKLSVSTLSAISADMGTLTAGTIQQSYTAPGDDNTTPGAGLKITGGAIEAYGDSHAFGGNLVASDGNYMVSIGRYLTAIGKAKRYPLHTTSNPANFTEDGRLHIYKWSGSAWVEYVALGYDASGGDYRTAYIKTDQSSVVGLWVESAGSGNDAIYGKASGSVGDGVVAYSENANGMYSQGVYGGEFRCHGTGGLGVLRLFPDDSASAPTHTANKGTIWITSGCVLYINTDGSTTWQKIGAQ